MAKQPVAIATPTASRCRMSKGRGPSRRGRPRRGAKARRHSQEAPAAWGRHRAVGREHRGLANRAHRGSRRKTSRRNMPPTCWGYAKSTRTTRIMRTIKQRWDGEAAGLRQKYIATLPAGPIRITSTRRPASCLPTRAYAAKGQANRGAASAGIAAINATLDSILKTSKYDPADAEDPVHTALTNGLHSQIDNLARNYPEYFTAEQAQNLKQRSAPRHRRPEHATVVSGRPERLPGRHRRLDARRANRYDRPAGVFQGARGRRGLMVSVRNSAHGLQAALSDAEAATGERGRIESLKRTTARAGGVIPTLSNRARRPRAPTRTISP